MGKVLGKCPDCGSAAITTTTLGPIGLSDIVYDMSNSSVCRDCGWAGNVAATTIAGLLARVTELEAPQEDRRYSLEQEIRGALGAAGGKWAPSGADLIIAVGQELMKGKELRERVLELFTEVSPRHSGTEHGIPSMLRRLEGILIGAGVELPPRCNGCSSLFAESPQSKEDGGLWSFCEVCLNKKKDLAALGGE